MKFCNKLSSSSPVSRIVNPFSNQSSTTIAKLDSGASAHYFRYKDAVKCLQDVAEDDGPEVVTPTLDTIKATHKGKLPFASKELSTNARESHVFGQLGSASLISVASMCDDGCQVMFDKNNAFITKNNKLLIKGYRNQHDKCQSFFGSNNQN